MELETVDHQDHLDRKEDGDKEDHQVNKVKLDQWEKGVLQVREGYLVPQETLDRPERMVPLDLGEDEENQDLLVNLVVWDHQELEVNVDPQEDPVLMV